jgi:hypothetical protein
VIQRRNGPLTSQVIPPLPLPLVPRCEEKQRRSPEGLNAGPVISDEDWSGTRGKGATTPFGVMRQISGLPPSSATKEVAGGGAGDVVDARQRAVPEVTSESS